jgi:hypothetical protein
MSTQPGLWDAPSTEATDTCEVSGPPVASPECVIGAPTTLDSAHYAAVAVSNALATEQEAMQVIDLYGEHMTMRVGWSILDDVRAAEAYWAEAVCGMLEWAMEETHG